MAASAITQGLGCTQEGETVLGSVLPTDASNMRSPDSVAQTPAMAMGYLERPVTMLELLFSRGLEDITP
jgi:hypothetical protein